jgi:hypothetical protein
MRLIHVVNKDRKRRRVGESELEKNAKAPLDKHRFNKVVKCMPSERFTIIKRRRLKPISSLSSCFLFISDAISRKSVIRFDHTYFF